MPNLYDADGPATTTLSGVPIYWKKYPEITETIVSLSRSLYYHLTRLGISEEKAVREMAALISEIMRRKKIEDPVAAARGHAWEVRASVDDKDWMIFFRKLDLVSGLMLVDRVIFELRAGRFDKVIPSLSGVYFALSGSLYEHIKQLEHSQKMAARRHAKNHALKDKARELFCNGQWPSIRKAAKVIYPQIAEYAAYMGVRLSPDRGEQTVYDWLRKLKQDK
jgi:hypothetical protein